MRLATERRCSMALFNGRLNAGREFSGRLFGRTSKAAEPDFYSGPDDEPRSRKTKIEKQNRAVVAMLISMIASGAIQ